MRRTCWAGPWSAHGRAIDGPEDSGESNTEFGWHAGGGLEILAGRHFGIHGDYRYIALDFGGDDEEDEGFIGGLLPGYKGSMWTLGATSTSDLPVPMTPADLRQRVSRSRSRTVQSRKSRRGFPAAL